MKPKTDPTDDSLISGLNIPGQNTSQTIPGSEFPSQGFQSPPIGQAVSTGENPSPFQQPSATPSPFASPQEPTSFNPPVNLPEPVNPFQTPDVPPVNPQQPVNQEMTQSQTTSSLDPPPAPASQTQPAPAPVNLDSVVVQEKPKKKLPVFLLILLILVIIVLGAVGYLAFQNYRMGKKVTQNPTTTQPTLQVPPTVDPYSGYIKYQSKILPIEFMIPQAWTANETQDEKLADQKMIDVNSPDFSYSESSIAAGFQFKVGPVNNLTKKYDSFDAFAAEENVQNQYSVKTINGKSWLVKGNEAKTLIYSNPLTVALYSSTANTSSASEIFNKILSSINILTPNTTTSVTPAASPSAAPLE